MRKTRVQTSVGERMREAARSAGLSAPQIAQRQGVKPASVYRWWNGERRPEEGELERYASLVGVPVEFLETGRMADAVLSVGVAGTEDASLSRLSNDALTRLMEDAVGEVRRRLSGTGA